MPNRIIKESVWTSPTINALTDLAERHFYRLLPLPDDHGCFQSSASVVKGRLYPLKPKITEAMIEKWHEELEQVGLIRQWIDGGRQFAIFLTFDRHQRIRSLHQRKTPAPPPLDDTCRQLTTSDGLIPIPIPILNPIPNPLPVKHSASLRSDEFEVFWKAYPRRDGSKQKAREAWATAIKKGMPSLDVVLASVKVHQAGEQWQTVKYIPHPTTWLNQARWESEPLPHIQTPEEREQEAYRNPKRGSMYWRLCRHCGEDDHPDSPWDAPTCPSPRPPLLTT